MHQKLKERHETRGARFGEREGVERLLGFGPFEQEYSALDASCALFDLSDRGLFALSGEDRVRFLNGLVTNDVARLPVGTGCRACQLNRQSKVLSDLRIYACPDRFLVETDPGFEVEALSHLRRYKIADRVEFEPLSDTTVRYSLQGPAAGSVLARVLGGAAADSARTLPAYGHRQVEDWGGMVLLRVPRTGRPGVDLIAPEAGGRTLWDALVGAGASPAGWLTLEAGRIEAGLPRFGSDFGPENLLMEAGLADALSFEKGCYVGQEIVARVRSRGHVNRVITGLRVDGETAPGDPVRMGDATLGRITSCAPSPRLGRTVALALVRSDSSTPEGASCFVGEAEPYRRATLVGRPLLEGLQP